MAQQLAGLVAVAQDLSRAPSSSQNPVTPALGDLMSGFQRTYTHLHTPQHKQTHIHT